MITNRCSGKEPALVVKTREAGENRAKKNKNKSVSFIIIS